MRIIFLTGKLVLLARKEPGLALGFPANIFTQRDIEIVRKISGQ